MGSYLANVPLMFSMLLKKLVSEPKALTRQECDKVQGREPGLPSGRDENEGRLGGRVLLHRLERGLVHRRHPRAVVLSRKAGNVDFDRNRTYRRPEVKEPSSFGLYPEPVGQVPRVGHGRRQSDDPQLVVGVRRDEVGSGDDDFEDGASILPEEVDLVDDDEPHGLDVVPGLPRT